MYDIRRLDVESARSVFRDALVDSFASAGKCRLGSRDVPINRHRHRHRHTIKIADSLSKFYKYFYKSVSVRVRQDKIYT